MIDNAEISRGKLAVGISIGLIAVLGVAFATGNLPFLNNSSADPVDQVPKGVDMVVYMDADIAEDPTTKQLANGLIDISKENNPAYTGPNSYEELLNNASSETDLDLSKLNEVAIYGKYPNTTAGTMGVSSTPSYVGFVISSGWGEEKFISAASEESSYSETTYQGYTLYKPEANSTSGSEGARSASDVRSMDSTPDDYIAVLGDGNYVIGTEQAVKDAVDVDRGATSSFSGDLRSAYEDTHSGDNTYLRFALKVPQDQIPETGMSQRYSAIKKMDTISGSYYTGDSSIKLNANMQVSSKSDADDLAAMIDGGLATVSQSTESEEARAVLDSIEVTQDGITVQVTADLEVEKILEAVRGYSEQSTINSSTAPSTS